MGGGKNGSNELLGWRWHRRGDRGREEDVLAILQPRHDDSRSSRSSKRRDPVPHRRIKHQALRLPQYFRRQLPPDHRLLPSFRVLEGETDALDGESFENSDAFLQLGFEVAVEGDGSAGVTGWMREGEKDGMGGTSKEEGGKRGKREGKMGSKDGKRTCSSARSVQYRAADHRRLLATRRGKRRGQGTGKKVRERKKSVPTRTIRSHALRRCPTRR